MKSSKVRTNIVGLTKVVNLPLGSELLAQWQQQITQKPLDDGEHFDVVVARTDCTLKFS